MNFKLPLLILFINTLVFQSTLAQQNDTKDSLYTKTWEINKRGMWVLTGWAATNIASSLSLRNTLSDEPFYFNQMNGLWNTVNLSLGTLGLIKSYSMLKQDKSGSFPLAINKAKKSYRINYFIDYGYIGAGIATTLLANRMTNPELGRGYGLSIITQGLFLLVFDYVMYKKIEKQTVMFD